MAQLVGKIGADMAYHHGEKSLQDTVARMAQDHVGTNNLPLLQPHGIFGLEPAEASEKVKAALQLIASMEAELETTRLKIKGQGSENLWTFGAHLVFGRLQLYKQRLEELDTVMTVRVDYEKLEKVELSDPLQAKHVH